MYFNSQENVWMVALKFEIVALTKIKFEILWDTT